MFSNAASSEALSLALKYSPVVQLAIWVSALTSAPRPNPTVYTTMP